MGIVLNWSTGYNGTPGSVDDTVTNFPTVTDGVHDVLASHVNSLAAAVIQLQTIQSGLSAITTQDEGLNLSTATTTLNFTGAGVTATNVGSVVTINIPGGGGSGDRIEDADADTYVDTDLAGGDSDIVTIAAANGVNVASALIRGTLTSTLVYRGARALSFESGNSTASADDVSGYDIQLLANDGGDEDAVSGGTGGSVSVIAGNGGAGSVAGPGGTVSLSAGDGGTAASGTPGAGGDVYVSGGDAGDDDSGDPSLGGSIVITAGSGSNSELIQCGTGGSVSVVGGSGGYGGSSDFVGNGGNVAILGGDPGTNDAGVTGNGGTVFITAASASSEGNGGSVQIAAGNAGGDAGIDGPGAAGTISVQGGTGAPAVVTTAGTTGGAVSIIGGTGGAGAGSAAPGEGGVVNIFGGDAGNVLSAGAPDGGAVNIRGGFGEGLSGFGGSVSIDAGDANGGAGQYGDVNIGGLETTQNVAITAQDDITFAAQGTAAPIPFNEAGDVDLDGSFTAVSIIGALNELKAGGGGGDHGGLTGLGDDDHTQYVLVDGTRAMSGGLRTILGTVGTTAVGPTGVTNTGVYFPSTTQFGISTGSVSRVVIDSTAAAFTTRLTSSTNGSFQGTNGGSGSNSVTFSFTTDTDSGMYLYNTNTVGIACGGNASYRLANGTLTFGGPQTLTTATGGITLDAPGTSDLTFDARSMSTPITLNQSGNTDLSGFTATSIIGALNELKSSTNTFTLNAAATIAVGDVVIVNGSGTVDLADANSGDQFVAGIAITGNTVGNPVVVQTAGVVTGLSGLTAGTRYYLSGTAGDLTATAPAGSGDFVIELGFALSSTSLLLRIQEGYEIP